MSRLLTVVAVVMVAGCSGPEQPFGRGGQKKPTIVVYRTKADQNVCSTVTTPYARVGKSESANKVKWKIDDDFDCLDGSKEIKIEFAADSPLRACNLASTGREIECDVRDVPSGTIGKYKVYFNNQQTEDPELEIGP